MRYCGYGTHRGTVSSHRTMVTDSTRQRDARQSAGPERDLVRGLARLQMAWPPQAVRELAHDLYAHESVGEERRAGSRLYPVATGADPPREARDRGVGQHDRQGPSGWDGGIKKTVRKPLAAPVAGGPPRFIWLPR